ncbi:hypothetical protein M407DRAFT_30683 [Tulasnella calospora MUT 4182]|uniref:Uncharacterized protein n=1 Tax=Tulasnella calospora MUT 4182 TaxID=1051891 RepID=A0A0C3LDY6_9AGAM|nr:hypothetical protein M407DRAFT_30683 [Tulasnella calospora MUT 4182]
MSEWSSANTLDRVHAAKGQSFDSSPFQTHCTLLHLILLTPAVASSSSTSFLQDRERQISQHSLAFDLCSVHPATFKSMNQRPLTRT